ncbi:putative fucosyltransferase [Cotonvirus japonicus]|uniref:Fucosyltransferase n=1 Tax=Cotonvirus japonicus TaxID=2811091 RepID=A0ABM7NTI7_9VIRU|nr:putative fucosyltransferase [Cotonvirus japonicus]BCS83483.1 putative fucosyltransferase [Cotonvirus japonicus]
MDNIKVVCINLKRRQDRRNEMRKKFTLNNILNYEFYEAVDGYVIDAADTRLSIFKHSNRDLTRRGFIGCALSHIGVWNQLINDSKYDRYLVIEDDVNFIENFHEHFENILCQLKSEYHTLLLGITVEKENQAESKKYYIDNTSYTIHELTKHLYGGGAFGYLLDKTSANHYINYINDNGVRTAIDYLMIKSGIQHYETHPHLILSDSVQHSNHFVDSDIQRDYNRIVFSKLSNNNNFDDYVFYPNKDSMRGDICELCADISMLKRIADNNDKCVAFNTYGWIKHTISGVDKFIDLPNKFYESDGLYVKRSYIDTLRILTLQEKKIIIQRKMQKSPIKFYIGNLATEYAQHIVDCILRCFDNYSITKDNDFDISINHIMETPVHKNQSLNISISGEPFNTSHKYDICIDAKHMSNSEETIHYPFLFSSLREHRKSIYPKDYIKPKTKFCAYMYNRIHNHRIWYFKLLSTYKHVDALGKCCRNVDIPDTRHHFTDELTYNDIAIEYYSEYKFVLAIENTFLPGYSTEKLINPMIANSIPIYWGDSAIFKYVNKRRVIYVPDFNSDQELLDYIKLVDSNDSLFNKIIRENIYVDSNFSLNDREQELHEKIKNSLFVVIGGGSLGR